MNAVSFPILRLPQSALKNALRQMCLVEHISLSVLSIRTKKQITMLDEVEQHVSLFVTSSILHFNLRSKWIYFEIVVHLDKPNVEIQKHVAPNNEFTTISVPEFTAKQLIDHLAFVFLKNARLTLLTLQRTIFENVYEYIRELPIVKLQFNSAEIQDCPLYDMFPLIKCLSFIKTPKNKSILIQNVEEMRFFMSKVTLNEILLSNCSSLDIDFQVISDKDLNLFVKHWIKGSNHRLELFQYHSRPNNKAIVESELFKGINYMVGKEDRYWKQFEIESNDGTKAMIALGNSPFVFFIICVSPLVLWDVLN